MLDVDSKDTSIGMSCPPQSFIQENFLQNIRSLLCDNGKIIINGTSIFRIGGRVMVFKATFSNISVMSLRSFLIETRVPGENHRR
jgi:hypothetical protein